MKLGAILLRQGAIDRRTLDRAVEIQKTWTSPIGTILMALGLVNSRQIALALAEQFSLSYRDPGAEPPDSAVLRRVLSRVSESFLRKHSALPLGEEDGKIAFATSDPTDPVFGKELPERLGGGIVLYVASERDMSRAFMSVFKQTYIDETVMGLFYRTPEQSAVQTFTNAQLAAIFLFVTALLAGAYYRPIAVGTAVVLAINILYLISILFKFAASMAGAHTEILQQVSDEEVAALKDEDLPVYTVLLPMYREPVVVATLIESVKKFDYPTSKLDVKILLEEDDVETYEALRRIQPPAHFEIVRVPYSFPKTKPKACNYGLLFARGAFLTIFDAEDIPDRDQLKKAFIAFAKGPENLVCVQAALNYFNARQNFLTKLFTLEYSYWFDYMLPGIEALRFPIPLGGTSNHFRVETLRALGGWDPFNVTEDADLGIRASARGYRIATVNSTTYEEANSRAGNWIRQRSRWIKGYMMTYLVHMLRPVRVVRRVAAAGGGHVPDLSDQPRALDRVHLLARVPSPVDGRLFPSGRRGDLEYESHSGKRGRNLHEHARRLPAAVLPADALRAAQSCVLDPAFHCGVQGAWATADESVLLGEDHSWTRLGDRTPGVVDFSAFCARWGFCRRCFAR